MRSAQDRSSGEPGLSRPAPGTLFGCLRRPRDGSALQLDDRRCRAQNERSTHEFRSGAPPRYLNVRTWSPGFIPAMAAGDVSATVSTIACVQLTESASWANERYSGGRLSIVPASRPISANVRFLHSSRLAARMRKATL